MYADDTNVTFSAPTIPDLESQVNSELENIDLWLKANKLSLNVTKTEFMIISSRQKLQSLRADVCKYRPEVGNINFWKFQINYVDYPRYSSNENTTFSFIG